MPNVIIHRYGPDHLDLIQPLWEALNRHHAAVSPHFKDRFEAFTFAQRKSELLSKTQLGTLCIFVAEEDEQPVGYCMASLSPTLEGEIESIFVQAPYRGKQVADRLMRAALTWMDDNNASAKSVSVVAGNERAFTFYARYGFLPRGTTLSQK